MATVTLKINIDPEALRAATAAMKEFGEGCRRCWILMPRKKKKAFKKKVRKTMEDYMANVVKENMKIS